MCVCVLLSTRFFAFFIDCPLSVLFMSPPRKLHPYGRSERDITSKRTSQRGAINSALIVALGIIKSLVATNCGPLLSAPFIFFVCLFFLARAKRAASATRGAKPLQYVLLVLLLSWKNSTCCTSVSHAFVICFRFVAAVFESAAGTGRCRTLLYRPYT